MKKFVLEYLGLQSPSTKSMDFYALSEAFHSLKIMYFNTVSIVMKEILFSKACMSLEACFEKPQHLAILCPPYCSFCL